MKTPYDVILKPVISEQSMEDAQAKKYTFKVADRRQQDRSQERR